jgi:tRNA (mo5U34)-methyltransferase
MAWPARLEAVGGDGEIAALGPWFHNLHLPDGRQTAPGHPLGDFPASKWRQIEAHVPADLSGWRALDIGCNAGFYSFALAARGAEVVALDVDPRYLRQARWAATRLGLAERVRFRQGTVYELARERDAFDLVLFTGVLYHLRHPLLALDIVARRVARLLVFQTLTMPGAQALDGPRDLDLDERALLAAPGWPRMAFLEHRLEGDPTNWWAPDPACCEALLRSSGLRVVARPGHEIYLCEPDPAADGLARRLADEELDAVLRAFSGAESRGDEG